MKKLPSKPSALIRLAIKDLEKVERSPDYTVDMYDWHAPGPQCAVCFAGAVMAQSLDIAIDDYRSPESFSKGISLKLRALNMFRSGSLSDGVRLLGLKKSLPYTATTVADYQLSPKQFKTDMHMIADAFAKAGY